MKIDVLTLECPICEGLNLHHKEIKIPDKKKKEITGNFLAVSFWCENCNLESILHLDEDSGETVVYWHEEDNTEAP